MKKPEFVTKIQTKIAPHTPYILTAFAAAVATVVAYETILRPDFEINFPSQEARDAVNAGGGGLRKTINGIDYALVRADMLDWNN